MSDTPFSSSTTCPPNKLCRLADAAIFRTYNNSWASWAKVARPSYTASAAAPLLSPPYTLVNDAPISIFGYGAEGTQIEKVGRTTGWATGLVSESCIDYNIDVAAGLMLLCQYTGTYYAESGDSGSPVFLRTNPSDPSDLRIEMVGMNCGTKGTNLSLFSPTLGVLWDYPNGTGGVMGCIRSLADRTPSTTAESVMRFPFLIAVLLVGGTSACRSSEEPEVNPPPIKPVVTRVVITAPAERPFRALTGNQVQFAARVEDQYGNGMDTVAVTWGTRGPAIVSISASGLAQLKAVGATYVVSEVIRNNVRVADSVRVEVAAFSALNLR